MYEFKGGAIQLVQSFYTNISNPCTSTQINDLRNTIIVSNK
jgi:hypothetical protein